MRCKPRFSALLNFSPNRYGIFYSISSHQTESSISFSGFPFSSKWKSTVMLASESCAEAKFVTDRVGMPIALNTGKTIVRTLRNSKYALCIYKQTLGTHLPTSLEKKMEIVRLCDSATISPTQSRPSLESWTPYTFFLRISKALQSFASSTINSNYNLNTFYKRACHTEN